MGSTMSRLMVGDKPLPEMVGIRLTINSATKMILSSTSGTSFSAIRKSAACKNMGSMTSPPAAGDGTPVKKSLYRTGQFLSADLDKASEANERQSMLVELEDGSQIVVVQIAGLVARRILCTAQEEQKMQAGERFGLIRFGSRCDVYLPEGAVPLVAIGQSAIAGETVLADLLSDEPERETQTA
ncbi:MAG: hypothetical protein EBT71_00410 [Alphaproteobacteria bacterium]|nr:hypothetical protein [Alphaproteobacteria bacterium]